MKKTVEEAEPAERPEINIAMNSIVEFQDPKQANGAAAAVLGLVRGVEYKAKGGARIQLVDASGATHSIAEKHVHINLGSYKGKLEEVADILKEFTAIMATEPTDLGVDPGDLEMAWELASDEGKASFSPKFLLSLGDDTFSKAQTDTYRAFRLLQSDMGKIFFKTLGPNEYKAKAAKAVQSSKENWCRSLEAEQEWFFLWAHLSARLRSWSHQIVARCEGRRPCASQ